MIQRALAFDHIWNKVIQPVASVVLEESDQSFKKECKLALECVETWRNELYKAYQRLRSELKDICYGPTDHRSPEELLDGRKIAAVLCAALISQKGFQFDTVRALSFAERKEKEFANNRVLFNRWAVANVYINYKLAYYASLQLVYLTLMRDFLVKAGLKDTQYAEQEEAQMLATQLNELGHLAPYAPPPRGDGFDVNIIIGLARTDMALKDFDMFMFAMQLYQIEEHTVDFLKKQI